jgi:uncharacterized protein YcbX
MITLSNLTYYPIKACRGFDLRESYCERMGLVNDRRMMVVTPEGEFLTQREHPRLALITPTLHNGSVQLAAPNFDSINVSIQKTGTPWPLNIWKSKGVHGIDLGEDAAQWLSDWLGAEVRLVHFAEGFKRTINEKYKVNPDDHTAFADGYPILLASEESLQELNSRLEAPVPMNRFRPNVVVKGCEPFAEDTWKRIRIGHVDLAVVKPCARCVVTTIDKETLEKSKEAMFGQNVIPLNEGMLEVGRSVEILE